MYDYDIMYCYRFTASSCNSYHTYLEDGVTLMESDAMISFLDQGSTYEGEEQRRGKQGGLGLPPPLLERKDFAL